MTRTLHHTLEAVPSTATRGTVEACRRDLRGRVSVDAADEEAGRLRAESLAYRGVLRDGTGLPGRVDHPVETVGERRGSGQA